MSYTAILAADKNIIPYRKELNAITGGVTSSILLQQISYWWVRSGSQPFYKFIQPCKHEKYHDGDSWIEELGFSRKEFLTAIKKLENSGLVKKRTNANRLTYYSLDETRLNQMLEGIYLNAERGFSKMPKGDLPLYTETTTETTTDIKNTMSSSSNVDRPTGRPDSKKWQTEAAKQLIDYLNQKAGRRYRHTASNIRLVAARFSEGYTPDDVARVIERKCAEWLNDPQMNQYLRPSTLFNATKFNDYVGQVDSPLPEKTKETSRGLAWDDTSWLEDMQNDPF